MKNPINVLINITIFIHLFIFITTNNTDGVNLNINSSENNNQGNINTEKDKVIDKIDESTKREIQEIKRLKKRNKLSACMAILRINLDRGNEKIKSLIGSSKFDKSTTYDFLTTFLIHNCIEKIKETEMEKILDPDNIFTYNKDLDERLMEITEDVNLSIQKEELNFTTEMKEILNDLKEAITSESTESNMTPEEVIGLFGIQLNQPGLVQYVFLGIGILLTIIIVFGGLYILLTNKKEKEKSKKDKRDRKKNKKEE